MNRQLRRATEKSDKKRDKERDKRRGTRRSTVSTVKNTSKPAQKTVKRESAEERNQKASRQQRWAGIYILMTVLIIGFQAALPEQNMDTFSLVIHGLFYLTFGYFLVSWLSRQRVAQALPISLVAGGLLACGVELVKYYRPEVSADPLLIYIALPSLLLGALLGRYVYTRTGA